MMKLTWYLNRLRAMNLPEVCWRIQQKELQRQEEGRFGKNRVSVCSALFYEGLDGLCFNPDAVGINFENKSRAIETTIHLLGGYDYHAYKNKWTAGFQTEETWEDDFSYSLNYKQRDDIGDARTNWELNRHYQFALEAKAYYETGREEYAKELTELFKDWNDNNPFLHGISWTSVMEIAIRCIQWVIALAYLMKCDAEDDTIKKGLRTGILNMASYVARHYSRFSSANNHLLVEATALAYAGYGFGQEKWQKLAIKLLDEQLTAQNYEDGVNKEMSLHYQTFGMEAYALTMHLIERNGDEISERWIEMTRKQCEFVAYSRVNAQTVCEFGDNDEGKILDLQGGEISHISYVMQLCSLMTGRRYEGLDAISETIKALFSEEEIDRCKRKNQYESSVSRTFKEGGYTFLKSAEKEVFVGIDHAPLGFGTIAAHGHADALSFQMYIEGKPVFIDPGTYIYHCWLAERNEFRKSLNHNTVVINGMEQSQMLGAFLWGKKAETILETSALGGDKETVEASSIGLSGIRHTRRFTFDRVESMLTIEDKFERGCSWTTTFMLAPAIKLNVSGRVASCDIFDLKSDSGNMSIEDTWMSEAYGSKVTTHAIRIKGDGTGNKVEIKIRS